MTNAWAAINHDGEILIDTVSSSDRAAMVNWLVKGSGFMVPQGMGDFAIREHFARLSKDAGVKVGRVEVHYGQ